MLTRGVSDRDICVGFLIWMICISLPDACFALLSLSLVGHETSAGIIAYTLHALSKDQQRQDKLRAELSAAGFSAMSGIQGREPTYDELMDPKTLPYLDAVVKEACEIPPFKIELWAPSLMFNSSLL